MKINNIDFVSSDGSNVSNFSFRDVNSENPYNVKDIVGLDADQIVPRFYGFSDLNASKYYSLSLEKREVVITISLNPQAIEEDTYAILRDKLYRNINSSRTGVIKLIFKNGATAIAQVLGFVTKFESNLFVQSPEVKITIDCDDPVLKSIEPFEVNTTGFANILTVLDEISTAPHGFDFGLTFTEYSNVFLMQDEVASGWRFNVIYDFVAGDQLRFSSRVENKYFYIVRAGVNIPLIDKLLTNAIWPVLFPGNNQFRISPFTGFTWDYVIHYHSYWGV